MSLIIDASPFPSPSFFPYDFPTDFPIYTNSIPSAINPPAQPAPAADPQPIPESQPLPQPTITPSSSPSKPALPQSAIIVLVSTIPIVAALVIIMAIIHCVRRRNKRRIAAQHQADIEKSLETGRRPVLAIDTDVPSRSGDRGRSGSWTGGSGRVQTPMRGGFGMGVGGMGEMGGEVPPVPRVPEQVYGGEGRERPRAWTRKSMSLPGVSGR